MTTTHDGCAGAPPLPPADACGRARSRARGSAPVLAAAAAAAVVVTLSACGASEAPAAGGPPIVLSSSDGSTPTSPASTTASAPPSSPAPGGAAPVAADVHDRDAELEADDQRGDGRSVRVVSVRLTAGAGHVAVVDTRTGDVLGSVAVRAGTTRGLTVPLTDPLSRSGELLLVLHADDGDGRFDAATDGRVVDDDGEPVDEDLDYTLR